MRLACSAGTSPKSKALISETARLNHSTRPSTLMEITIGKSVGICMRLKNAAPALASNRLTSAAGQRDRQALGQQLPD